MKFPLDIDFDENAAGAKHDNTPPAGVQAGKPYQECMPKCKELFALMEANGYDDEELKALNETLDKLIAKKKSRKPAPNGKMVSTCPHGKHLKRTKVADWSQSQSF
jgi:hypothetical protein